VALRDKLKKLEQEVEPHYETLHLPDGTQVRYTDEDALDALSACVDEEEHWLIPHFRDAGVTAGLPGLVRALEASKERIEEREEYEHGS